MKHTTDTSQLVFQFDEIPSGYCQCGCGQKTTIYKGRARLFFHGHNARKKYDAPGPNPSGLCMCGCGQKTEIARQSETEHGYIQGKPVRFVLGHNFHKGTVRDRFWQNIKKCGPDECWDWTGSLLRSGYGQFSVATRTSMLVHRFSYELHNGPIPDGLFVCHSCDNRKCCNPAHLWLGTSQDNAQDMVAKGRGPQRDGELSSTAIFTNEEARKLRAQFKSLSITVLEFSRMHNVNLSTMSAMLSRIHYKRA